MSGDGVVVLGVVILCWICYKCCCCCCCRNRMRKKFFFCCSNLSDYKNRWNSSESTMMIKEFITFCREGEGSLPATNEAFAIQFVKKQDFGPTLSIEWYIREGTGFKFDPTSNSKGIFKRSNHFKNFKCREHSKFFELNLYTRGGISYHHESTRSGRSFPRDESIDQIAGSICTKGAHWKYPAKKVN